MSKKSRPAAAVPMAGFRPSPVLPAAMVQEIIALTEAGRWDQLEGKARVTVQRFPTHPLGWKLLGTAQLKRGAYAEAALALGKTARLVPGDANAHNDLGVALAGLGRQEEAAQSYRKALKADAGHAQSHSNLGMLLSQAGDFEIALPHLQQAIALQPQVADSHNNLGTAWRDRGRLREAEAAYRRALALDPGHVGAWINLGHTCNDLEAFAEAEAAYRQALALQPDARPALIGLGGWLRRFGSKTEAITCFERCIALQPAESDALVELGNVYLDLGDQPRSQALFRQAQALRPLITWRSKQAPPAFSAVLLDTPGASCTPISYLLGTGDYDRHYYCVNPEPSPYLALLQAKADVVFNLIADADNGADILPAAAALADQIGRPVVNHPRAVMRSGRDAAEGLLAGIALCRVPRTRRFSGQALLLAASDPSLLEGLRLPLLVRPTGKHGGEEFEKFDELEPLVDFVSPRADADFYLTEFVDYRSADGHYRKYRFIVVDGELHPYHLAIHDHWKVHHFRTDMANQPWMREEEAGFLDRPKEVFDAPRQAALQQMAAAIGLDYFGLDVALDSDRQIVLFEANAAMLVHDEKGDTFAYKNPYIFRIKQAVDAMLARRAGLPMAEAERGAASPAA